MMARRKIRDAADAERCISAARSEGRSLGEWARSRGIDGRSLHTWSLNLSRRGRDPGQEAAGLRLVELVPASRATSSKFTVRVGPVVVEVEPNFDEVALRRLLAVVSAC